MYVLVNAYRDEAILFHGYNDEILEHLETRLALEKLQEQDIYNYVLYRGEIVEEVNLEPSALVIYMKGNRLLASETRFEYLFDLERVDGGMFVRVSDPVHFDVRKVVHFNFDRQEVCLS